MRNFILFIRRFFNLILFLGLEIVCFILIARTNTMQGNDVMNSANAVTGQLYSTQNDIASYFNLKAANKSLADENARLRRELALRDDSYDTLKSFSKEHSYVATNDTSKVIRYADYTYRVARVINNSVSEQNNYITLNRGYEHGIRKNMSVVSSEGVVGKIVNVSEHFSTAISVLSARQPVSGRLKSGTYGNVEWDGRNPDYMFMSKVPQEIKVYRGDSVMTTSYSFFPPNVLIGRVERIRIMKKDNSQTLVLRTASNFRNLQYVYVVENGLLQERVALEDSTAKLNKPRRRP